MSNAKEPCCNKKCPAPLKKFFSTDAPHGFCGEACMDPKRYNTFHFFEKNLTLATSEHPCSQQRTPSNTKRYTEYFDTVTHGGGGISVTLDLYAPTGMPDHSKCCSTPLISSLNCVGIPGKPTSLSIFGTGPYCCPKGATETNPCAKEEIVSEEVQACQPFNKVSDGKCGELCLDDKVGVCPRALVVKSGGLEAGSCKDLGYTTAAGEKDQKAGPCGTLKVETYTKPGQAVSEEVKACQPFNKVADGKCGELCLDDSVGICPRSIIVKTGGLVAGSCKALGYTEPAGEQDQAAGPCGTLKIQKFSKPTEAVVV